MAGREVLPVLLRGFDAAWERLRERTAGLDDDEYRWVHATDELAHHGAEITLLRDLHRWR